MTEYDLDIENFKPTNRQKVAKKLLHSNVNPQVIGSLTPETITRIRQFLFPIKLEEILEWHRQTPVFWVWFKIDQVHFGKMDSLKRDAVMAVNDVLMGNFDDPKAANVRLAAAKLVMDFGSKQQTNVTANTMNITAKSGIPKALAKKSNEELEAQILKLEQDHDLA